MTYLFTCDDCGAEEEVSASIQDGPPPMSHCTGMMRQVYTTPQVINTVDAREAIDRVVRGDGGEEIPGLTREQVAATVESAVSPHRAGKQNKKRRKRKRA